MITAYFPLPWQGKFIKNFIITQNLAKCRLCHCEQSEAIQEKLKIIFGLLRRKAPRNDGFGVKY